MGRLLCFCLVFLAVGCQKINIKEMVTKSAQAEEEPKPLSNAEVAQQLKASCKQLNSKSNGQAIDAVVLQAQELENRLATVGLDVENATLLLTVRAKVAGLNQSHKQKLISFCERLETEFAGQSLGLQATLVRFISTHDVTKDLEVEDLKDLKTTATKLASHQDKATLYTAIVRKLKANGRLSSAKQTLQLAMAHVKGTSSWSKLFNEQFALGFKQNPSGTKNRS